MRLKSQLRKILSNSLYLVGHVKNSVNEEIMKEVKLNGMEFFAPKSVTGPTQ